MLARYAPAFACLLIAPPALAGGGINYTATDSDGTVERVVETRSLSTGATGAVVSYERTDGSRTLVEYAVDCDPLGYAYLGIVEENPKGTPNPRSARVISDEMLANPLRPVSMQPIGDDTFETEIRSLASAICS